MKLSIKYIRHLVLLTVNRALAKSSLRNVKDGLYRSSIRRVPYISQFAKLTTEKDIKKIVVDPDVIGLQGYPTKEDFYFWNSRVCGIACIKMVLDSQEKSKNKTMWDFIQEGLELGGYKLHDAKGKFVDLGWFHKPLLELAQRYGMHGFLKQSLAIHNVAEEIVNGNYVIASVKVPDRYGLEDDGSYFKDSYRGKTYGHLILVTAVEIQSGFPKTFLAHNPTGYKKYEEDSIIDAETFTRIFNGRVIVLKASSIGF